MRTGQAINPGLGFGLDLDLDRHSRESGNPVTSISKYKSLGGPADAVEERFRFRGNDGFRSSGDSARP
jgi:hypothetical protein